MRSARAVLKYSSFAVLLHLPHFITHFDSLLNRQNICVSQHISCNLAVISGTMIRMDKQTFMKQAALRQPTYAPSDAVKQQLAQVDLIITAGPTGVGKTTIMEHSGIPYITSDVTREPRKGEQNGIDYTFRDDFDQLMQEIENGE